MVEFWAGNEDRNEIQEKRFVSLKLLKPYLTGQYFIRVR